MHKLLVSFLGRWRYLWPYILTLNFDAEKDLCGLYKLSRINPEGKELKRRRYVDWVDSVMKLHRAPNIENFRVSFDLGPRSSIDESIRFAMRKGVQMLELDLLEYPAIRLLTPVRYSFCPNELGEQVGFKSLKVLDFKSVDDAAGNVLEYFSSNHPHLERLSVSDSPSLVNLRVISPSAPLKYLVIQRCYNIRRVEISDANLVSFIYDNKNEINLLLKNLRTVSC